MFVVAGIARAIISVGTLALGKCAPQAREEDLVDQPPDETATKRGVSNPFATAERDTVQEEKDQEKEKVVEVSDLI